MNTRIIAKLDLKPPYVVKLVHFEGLRRVGLPFDLAKKYYDQGAHELFYIHIVSSLYQRDLLSEGIKKTAIKFGIGRATYDSAQSIRNGDIIREEGITLIKRFDGEFPNEYIKDCGDYMDIIMQQYHNLIEKFRSPHLWHKINGNFELKNPIWKG
jgi:hypothetical protein